jgi:NADPH:quinone reductase-like Zn-dependent oxidoreductase
VIALSDWFTTLVGTQAEEVVLDASAVAYAPQRIAPEAASTIPLNGLTALQALDVLALEPGQSVVVIGAAGGVGGYALELALHRGLAAIGIASPGDEEFITGLGARFVARGDSLADIVPGGADGVFDAVPIGASALSAVRDGGAFVTILDGKPAPDSERGVRVSSVVVHSDGEQLAYLVALADAGELTMRVADTYPLARVAAAHERFTEGGVRGRLVLIP